MGRVKDLYPGIDYGMGTTNVDSETGIRYGVISQHDVLQAWCDSAEPDYGDPTCPHCGNELLDSDLDDVPEDCDSEYWCPFCQRERFSDDVWSCVERSNRWLLNDGEYKAEQGGDDSDIFVTKSPYYTYAQFCSPCAPGAGHLGNPLPKDVGVKTYCFGEDFFEGIWEHKFWVTSPRSGGSIEDYYVVDHRCPYPYWSVETDELVYSPEN